MTIVCMNGQNKSIEPNYLEDQLYFGMSYNSLVNGPNSFEQNGFSYGVNFGFIRDIPFNAERNIGIGVGVGYSYDTYTNNLLIRNINDKTVFNVSNAYDSNTMHISSIDVPLEFRWRTSSLEKYKFWRIYTGVKFSYIFNHKNKFALDDSTELLKNMTQLKKFQSGIYTAMGYNTWNFYIHYSVTSLLKKNTLTEGLEQLELNPLKLGLIFYIL